MRGLGRKLAAPSTLLPSSSSLPFSTFSSSGAGREGGGGGGGGRGRGLTPPPPPPSPPSSEPQHPSPLPSHGHGSGSAPGGPHLPVSFPSFDSSSSSSLGRGLGGPPKISDSGSAPKKPIFLNRGQSQFADPDETLTRPRPRPQLSPPQPHPTASGAGRGIPPPLSSPDPRPAEPNRHAARGRAARPQATPIGEPAAVGPKLSREEAIKKAMEVLSRGGDGGGGRGRGRGRGMGRGMNMRRGKGDADEGYQLDLGDNADGERFVKKMGEERMKIVEEAFEEMSWRVLPSPMEEAYLDALHTNNMIEYEQEYLVEFDRNPDIDEKPPMSLEEVLQKAKPFLMAYEGIKSQEEWEEIIKDLMERLPHMKELMDMYCGPDRVTAKQQQEELERVAKTIPENVPSSVKRFTNRAVLSLQSNPGWGWDKKCQFMDKLSWELNQHYK